MGSLTSDLAPERTFDSYRENEGRALLELLYDNPGVPIAIDTETTGLRIASGTSDYAIGVSIATVVDGNAYSHYYAFRHLVGVNCDNSTWEMLQYVLEEGDHLLIFANVQFDILALNTLGIDLDDKDFIDVCTMAHYVNENFPRNKGVDSLAHHYLDAAKVSDPILDKEKKTGWPNTTPEMMWEYAVVDAELTYRIWMVLSIDPIWLALPEYIWPDKQRLIRVLLVMRRRGIRIDTKLAQHYVDIGVSKMAELVEQLGMNPGSPKQLKVLLVDQLGLPVVKETPKGAPSFDKEAMEEYDLMLERIESPIAKLVKEYRGWQKAVSAAYRPYLELLDEDGRLRTSYKTHGTVTGRLSSSEPNLQQIPKTTDKPWNGKVKECFIAREGYTLINADFSQLELRLATAYAGEDDLKEVFREGRDIFTEMSGSLGMERHDTKTLVYSMQYGAGINRIVHAFGVDEARAKAIRSNYLATYPKFRALNERCSNRVAASKVIQIWTGRYRHFRFKNEGYKAMNSVIQGGAADIVERIMVRCYDLLDNEDCQMLLQVHDSITFEVKTELVEEYLPKIKAVMEDVTAVTEPYGVVFDVKFAVDVDYWVKPEEMAA